MRIKFRKPFGVSSKVFKVMVNEVLDEKEEKVFYEGLEKILKGYKVNYSSSYVEVNIEGRFGHLLKKHPALKELLLICVFGET